MMWEPIVRNDSNEADEEPFLPSKVRPQRRESSYSRHRGRFFSDKTAVIQVAILVLNVVLASILFFSIQPPKSCPETHGMSHNFSSKKNPLTKSPRSLCKRRNSIHAKGILALLWEPVDRVSESRARSFLGQAAWRCQFSPLRRWTGPDERNLHWTTGKFRETSLVRSLPSDTLRSKFLTKVL